MTLALASGVWVATLVITLTPTIDSRFSLFANDTAMNLLKVNASELAVSTVMSAMQACGLAGYRNDGEFSMGRHLRDILSSPIMISNDRILTNIAAASLLSGAPNSLSD